jgi:hypothetical protein
MTDRELLELAAKACGLEEAKLRIEFNQWNPLTDDGDALRLAVAKAFHIKVFRPVHIEGTASINHGMIEIWREDDNDPIHVEWYAADPLLATRRAIVRAAAEIGRNMK